MSNPPGDRQTLLVVDDAPENIEALAALLRDTYKVQAARDGARALKVARSERPPDLVLLDIVMPEMDGYEVCRQLKADPATAGIPVIFLTGKTTPEDEARGFKVGAVDYITKPFVPEIVRARVKTHLDLVMQQRELACKNVQLEELMAQKDEFLGMAVHDLRNPLANLIGYAKYLLQRLSRSDDARVISILESMSDSGEFMLGLVEDLLSISELESGKLKLRKVEVELPRLLQHTTGHLQFLADQKEIEICLSAAEELPPMQLDTQKLEQVVNNLVGNAVKFCSQGARIEVELTRPSSALVKVAVRDNGPGIPEAEQHKLFQAFGTTSVRGSAGERSTGLGLMICKRLVEAHQGQIGVESQVGQGTTFWFTLPVPATP